MVRTHDLQSLSDALTFEPHPPSFSFIEYLYIISIYKYLSILFLKKIFKYCLCNVHPCIYVYYVVHRIFIHSNSSFEKFSDSFTDTFNFLIMTCYDKFSFYFSISSIKLCGQWFYRYYFLHLSGNQTLWICPLFSEKQFHLFCSSLCYFSKKWFNNSLYTWDTIFCLALIGQHTNIFCCRCWNFSFF